MGRPRGKKGDGKARPRVQYEASEKHIEAIDRLVTETGRESRRELIDEAIELYRWTAEEIMRGAVVCSKDTKDGTITRFLTPGLGFLERKHGAKAKSEG